MPVRIYKDYKSLSEQVALEILAAVKEKPDAVLCLAAGDTPRLAYALLVNKSAEAHVDFSQCTFVGLDEWVAIPPENPGSCQFFLRQQLFSPLGIQSDQIHLFNSMAKDMQQECKSMDAIIQLKGGIDLMLVGVGMNGHIGFNEPGVAVDLFSHVIELDATTQSVGQKYFTEPTEIHQGITLGLQHLLDSRECILMASGTKKAEVIRKTLEGPVSGDVPASIIRQHPQALIMLDEDAAALLKRFA